mmetsp:Transcript_5155/g.9012  ORF Transcript_5155/g.9012 Transcript_5155/m.9012 type:complete len:260 (-) Transcript_5155:329-1108(-)
MTSAFIVAPLFQSSRQHGLCSHSTISKPIQSLSSTSSKRFHRSSLTIRALSEQSPSNSSPITATETDPTLNLKRAAASFWRSGWLAFWPQLALTLVSSGILIFALAFPAIDASARTSLLSVTLICTAAIISFLSTLWTFSYTRIGYRCRLHLQQIASDKEKVTSSSIQNSLRIGILLATFGTLLCVIGLQSTTGSLLSKLLTQSFGVSNRAGNALVSAPVQPIDIFVIQAAANTMLSLQLALAISLWLTTQYRNKAQKA